MLLEDEIKLVELFEQYPPKVIMTALSAIAQSVADDCSDNGFSDKAKELTLLSVAIDDIISGRPYLV